MSHRAKPKWRQDGVFETPQASDYEESLADLANTAPENLRADFGWELWRIADRLMRDRRQIDQTPDQAEVNAALAIVLRRLKDFRSKLETAPLQMEWLRAMPAESGDRSNRWFWYQDAAWCLRMACRWTARTRLLELGPSGAKPHLKLAKSAEAVYFVLTELDHESTKEIVKQLPQRIAIEGTLHPLVAYTDAISVAVSKALELGRARRGARPSHELAEAIAELAEAYEDYVGRFTHTPYGGADDYKAAPQSDAGRFVLAFMNIVSDVRPHTISSHMARVVRERRI